MANLKKAIIKRMQQGSIAVQRALGHEGTLPGLIIAGVQKCGTSSLFRNLAHHPQLHPARRKQIHFFDQNFDKSLSWYRGYFPKVADGITYEATPSYLFYPPAPSRIAELLPDTRLAVVLRDPARRACSHHHMMRAMGHETLDLAQALDAEEERCRSDLALLQADSTYQAMNLMRFSYVGRGLYAQQLARLWQHHPRENTHVMFLEELVRNTQPTLTSLFAFLGLPDHAMPALPNDNKQRYEAPPDDLMAQLRDRFAEPDRELEDMLQRPLPWS